MSLCTKNALCFYSEHSNSLCCIHPKGFVLLTGACGPWCVSWSTKLGQSSSQPMVPDCLGISVFNLGNIALTCSKQNAQSTANAIIIWVETKSNHKSLTSDLLDHDTFILCLKKIGKKWSWMSWKDRLSISGWNTWNPVQTTHWATGQKMVQDRKLKHTCWETALHRH